MCVCVCVCAHVQAQVGEGQRERGLGGILSRPHAVSREPDVGLEPTNVVS